jgi:hypothetical protein
VGARTEYKEEGRFSGAIRSIREHGSGGKREHSVTQRSAFSDQPSAISLQQSAFSNQPGSAFFASPAAKITLGRVLTAES